MQIKYEIGILGGMGPLATVDLMNRITEYTFSDNDQGHIPTVTLSNTLIPDRTEHICYGGQSPVPYLIKSIRNLDMIGVNRIVIPCNTSHYYINELKRNTKTRIIDMVEETTKYLKKTVPNDKVVILGTDGLIKGNVYRNYLLNNDIINYDLEIKDQEIIMNIIRKIKANGISKIVKESILNALIELDPSQSMHYVLACTELSLLKDFLIEQGWNIVDAMDILAISAIKESGFRLNLERVPSYYLDL